MKNLAAVLLLNSKLSGKNFNVVMLQKKYRNAKKQLNIQKLQLKCKNFEKTCKAQTASHLEKIIQPLSIRPPHQIKPYYVSETKTFLRRYIETYRRLLSRCFKNAVLGRQEIMQCKYFFLKPNRNLFARKFVKSERFLDALRGHIIFNVK